jgi:hypothetical protein
MAKSFLAAVGAHADHDHPVHTSFNALGYARYVGVAYTP